MTWLNRTPYAATVDDHAPPRLAGAFVLAGLILAACAASSSQSPTESMPATARTIEATTQMHLDGVAVGVGNIREETYTSADGSSQTGLTAAITITVENDASLNQQIRVHPGQDVDVPGYRLHVIAVVSTEIVLDVIEVVE
jgi:FtsP/CotA-like multicopper oxidase with cupredoxin domain